MDIEQIKVGSVIWNNAPSVETLDNASLKSCFFSWEVYSVPSRFINCDGNFLAIRKCTFINQTFVNCNFDKVDASDSTFIDCLFLNCTFKNANFHKSTFIGSCIRNETDVALTMQDSFVGAGLSLSKFKSSNKNKSVLSNLNFENCGFRHSVFEDTIFEKVEIRYASFEDVYLRHCEIDLLDLRKSACRGIIIMNCQINKYISSLEKTLGAIGALQALKSCKVFELKLLGSIISTEKELISSLKVSSSNFLNEGKLFEFFNIMIYLLNDNQNIEIVSDTRDNLSLLSNVKHLDGYQTSVFGDAISKLMNQAYEQILKDGKTTNLDDIVYSLRLLFFQEKNEFSLLKFFLDIFMELIQRNSEYSDFLIISEIKEYFHILSERIKSDKYILKFHNSNAHWKDEEERKRFYEFCRLFIEEGIGENDYCLISMHEGSIISVFESLFNFRNVMIASVILGCRVDFKDNQLSIYFSPKEGIESFVEFLKEIKPVIHVIDNKTPTEIEFKNALDKIKPVKDKIKLYLEDNNIVADIRQNDASKVIEETIRNTTFQLTEKIKITSSETQRKLIEFK